MLGVISNGFMIDLAYVGRCTNSNASSRLNLTFTFLNKPCFLSFTLRRIHPDSDIFNIISMGVELDSTLVGSSREEVIKAFYEISGLTEADIEFGDIVWLGAFTPNVRMVDRFSVGRVLLAGGQ